MPRAEMKLSGLLFRNPQVEIAVLIAMGKRPSDDPKNDHYRQIIGMECFFLMQTYAPGPVMSR